MRPLTDGGFLTYPCVFPGCITKAISLDSVFTYRCMTRCDGPTDPSLLKKLNMSQLFDAGNRADGTDGPTMHFERAPCKVNEIRRLGIDQYGFSTIQIHFHQP